MYEVVSIVIIHLNTDNKNISKSKPFSVSTNQSFQLRAWFTLQTCTPLIKQTSKNTKNKQNRKTIAKLSKTNSDKTEQHNRTNYRYQNRTCPGVRGPESTTIPIVQT